jgi:hypothetical protein
VNNDTYSGSYSGQEKRKRNKERKKENELTIHIIGYVNTLYSPV